MPEHELDNVAYVRAVHDKGLQFDMATMSRRKMLVAIGGAGAIAMAGGTMLTAGSASAATLEEVESETAGPYPADGSNRPDVRTESGIVRSDIRPSFGTATGTAAGVPLAIALTLEDLTGAPLAGAAVYLWHCDRDGNYSLYSTGSPTRTTCAASRRPTPPARSPSPASFRPAIRAGGRISTSRSTRRWPTRRAARGRSPRPRRWPSRRRPPTSCTRPTATARASPTSVRSPWRPTTSSATTPRPAKWPP